MKPDIIFITGDFPAICGDSDPDGIYFYDIARQLTEEAGKRIQVAAFRIDGRNYHEEKTDYRSDASISRRTPAAPVAPS